MAGPRRAVQMRLTSPGGFAPSALGSTTLLAAPGEPMLGTKSKHPDRSCPNCATYRAERRRRAWLTGIPRPGPIGAANLLPQGLPPTRLIKSLRLRPYWIPSASSRRLSTGSGRTRDASSAASVYPRRLSVSITCCLLNWLGIGISLSPSFCLFLSPVGGDPRATTVAGKPRKGRAAAADAVLGGGTGASRIRR